MPEELKQTLEDLDIAGAIEMSEHLGIPLEVVLDKYCGIKL